jgi:hypothetical protein
MRPTRGQTVAMTAETPRRAKPPPRKGGTADPAQYERFAEAARELGCEENSGRLDEVVRRAAKLPSDRAATKRVRERPQKP